MSKIPYTQYFKNNELNKVYININELVNDIIELVLKFFKEKSIQVPPSQVYQFAELLKTYIALKNSIDDNDILYIVESVFTTVHWNQDLYKQFKEYLLSKNRETKDYHKLFDENSIVSRIRFGKTVSIQNLLSQRPSRKELLEYVFLRKIGVLKRDKSGRLRAAKYSEFMRALRRNSSKLSNIDVNDIIKYLPEIPSRYWRKLLTKDLIDKASLDQLLKLGEYVYKIHNKELGIDILSRISQIVSQGLHLRKKERKIVYKLMKQYGYNNNLLIIETMPLSIDDSKMFSLSFSELLSKIYSLPLEERIKLVSKLSKGLESSDINLIKSLDLITLSGINTSTNKRLKNKSLLGKALTSLVKYYIFGNESYLDYGLYHLETIDEEFLDPLYKPIYESLLNGDYYKAIEKLNVQDKQALLEYIVTTVRSHDVMDSDEVLERALELGYRILRNMIFKKGSIYEGKRIGFNYGEKIAVRNTIYRFLRLSFKIMFVRRLKGKKIIAVLDISGSMLPYSLWAIMSLATIIHRIKYLVLFSEYVEIIKVNKKKSFLIKLLNNLCKKVFQGYTDIAKAINVVNAKLCRDESIVVVISDLKQTKPGDPLSAFNKLVEKGCKSIVITHSNHDRDLAIKLKSLGVDVIVTNSPYELPFILKKKLNLKGGVIKESKRLKNL